MQKRQNGQWIDDLRGSNGEDAQRASLNDLGKYLTKVSYNSLLRHLEDSSLAQTLSVEFAQEALVKICKDDFASLSQFRGEGNFTSWAATICSRIILRQIKKPNFKVYKSTDADSDEKLERLKSPGKTQTENIVLFKNVEQALQDCLDSLSRPRRIALDTILLGISAAEAGEKIGAKSANAVHSQVHRAKWDLKNCLETSGFDKTVLDLFE